MTTVVLLVLAVAWGTVLVFWLRSRSQNSFGDSVGTFHRHLHVLERAAPVRLSPANSMRGPAGPIVAVHPRATGIAPRLAASSRRRATIRRRRNVLVALLGLVVVTLLAAVVGHRGALVALQLLADVALAAYVSLLVRLRTLAAERRSGLAPARRLRPVAGARPAGYALGRRGVPALAAGGAYAPDGYDDLYTGGYSTGELVLGHAVGH